MPSGEHVLLATYQKIKTCATSKVESCIHYPTRLNSALIFISGIYGFGYRASNGHSLKHGTLRFWFSTQSLIQQLGQYTNLRCIIAYTNFWGGLVFLFSIFFTALSFSLNPSSSHPGLSYFYKKCTCMRCLLSGFTHLRPPCLELC